MRIDACLAVLGVTRELVAELDIEEGFGKIKSVYFKRALATHPDKGGDAAAFRDVQEAWELLRSLYDEGKVAPAGWASYFDVPRGAAAAAFADAPAPRAGGYGRSRSVPSWEWFEAASAEPVPGYKVEAAKSGRSKCKGCASEIGKGELRCGSLDPEAGSYGRWHHLQCWRVPAVVWLGLPDAGARTPAAVGAALGEMGAVTLSGFNALSAAQQASFVDSIMDASKWARRSAKATAAAAAAAAAAMAAAAAARPPPFSASSVPAPRPAPAAAAAGAAWPPPAVASSTALVAAGGTGSGAAASQALVTGRFVLPRPGLNGAVAGALAGQTFVMTGVFPEVGGGAGLDLGKERLRAAIEAFGGRVTSAVSGKTTYLMVGREPGGVKVAAARAKGVPMLDPAGLKAALEGGGAAAAAALADAPAPTITSYSSGYFGNGVGHILMDEPAAAAARPPKAPKAKRAPAAKKGRRISAAAAAAAAAEQAAPSVLVPPPAAPLSAYPFPAAPFQSAAAYAPPQYAAGARAAAAVAPAALVAAAAAPRRKARAPPRKRKRGGDDDDDDDGDDDYHP